jgi:ATP-dependent RNA helicase DDX56/DBP9
VVEEFNKGVYDVVVATDEGAGAEEPEEEDQEEDETAEVEVESAQPAESTNAEAGPSKRRAPSPSTSKPVKRQRKGDTSSSMARGIDFTSASSVINFDLPTTSTAYLHRVGRTARAGHSGLALSFVVPRKDWGKDKQVSLKSAEKDELVWERIKDKVRREGDGEMKIWDWGGRKSEVEGFRYRMEDALRAVTGKRVAEARREEVRRELLNSEKLKVGNLLPYDRRH